MTATNVAAWAWAQAAVSKRLIVAGVDEPYLAQKYATDLAGLSAERISEGAVVIRQVMAELTDEERAEFATTVEQRDTLAALFEPPDLTP